MPGGLASYRKCSKLAPLAMKILSTMASLAGCCCLTMVAVAQTPAIAPATRTTLSIPASDDGLPGAGPIRRQDWFQKVWLERRTAWAQRVEQDQRAVVFLGDSITQGWGDRLETSFPGMKVANRGISGDTTRGVLIRLKDDVLSLRPRAVVLLIGTNDLEENADPEIVAANLKLILAALKQHGPEMPIVLCQVMPSAESKKRPAAKIKRLNELYAAAVKGDPQVTLIETWTLFADANGDAKASEFPDLLHPNDMGYAKWAAALRPIFSTLGFLERERDDFTIENDFVPLFNGSNLDGWRYGTNRFSDETETADGRYVAKLGRLIVTTPPEGRKIVQLWTTEEFPKDFILKLEFRATPNADSGIFIRGPQLQCRDYSLAGPYKQLKNYRPQEWNQIEIMVTNNVAHCTCNGEVLEAAMKLPATGPIGLEGDRGQMEYRRIRIHTIGMEP